MITAFKTSNSKTKICQSGSNVELDDTNLTEIAGQAVFKASKKAMKTMGYIVEVENGWIVKKYASGYTKKLKKLKESTSTLVFD